jgi:hypothetical protein
VWALCWVAKFLVARDRKAIVILWPLSCLLDELAQPKADYGGANRLGDGDSGMPNRGSGSSHVLSDRHGSRRWTDRKAAGR